MGEFILNGRNYGGSIITPNPSDTPTDTLDSVKIGDTTYEIQGGGGGGSNLIIDAKKYSLGEEVIGIWTDGKPLYQKTVAFGNLSSGTQTISMGLSNTETVIKLDINAQVPSGAWLNLPMTYINTSLISQYGAVSDGYNASTDKVTINVGSSRSFTQGYITILYTKTTDTAGSGGYQAYGFSPIIYSETEREVGVWRDNKPLYQKTINCGALPNNTDKRVQHGIQNVDCFVGVFGIAENPNINSIPIIFSNSGGSGIATVILEKSSDIIIRCNSDRSTYTKTFITLQYTKSSDVAGSGEYNTLAIPNVHYSTDEQVIGTWMGETLYQKTWSNLAVWVANANAWVNTGLSATDIDTIVDGFMQDDNKQRIGGTIGFMSSHANIGIYSQLGNRHISTLTIQYTKTTD